MKIALVGSAPTSNRLAPFHDPRWQIWACSPDNREQLPRIDLWFELHGDLGWHEYISWAPDYCQWLQGQTFPVFAQDQTYIPRAMTFPMDALIAKYGRYHFTSSFSWMIAYAFEQGATEIGLFGVDMTADQEYARQRPGFQHFMTLAAQKGIRILAPDESDILQPPPLYGYDRSTAFVRKLYVRRNEIQGRIDKLQSEVRTANHHITHLQGALDNLDYIESVWTGLGSFDNASGPAERHHAQESSPGSDKPNSCVPEVSVNPAHLNGRQKRKPVRSTSQSEILGNG